MDKIFANQYCVLMIEKKTPKFEKEFIYSQLQANFKTRIMTVWNFGGNLTWKSYLEVETIFDISFRYDKHIFTARFSWIRSNNKIFKANEVTIFFI